MKIIEEEEEEVTKKLDDVKLDEVKESKVEKIKTDDIASIIKDEDIKDLIAISQIVVTIEDFVENKCYEGKVYPNKESDARIKKRCKKRIIENLEEEMRGRVLRKM